MTRPIFSTELFNARVETQIQGFFETISDLYERRGWRLNPARREDFIWQNEDFTVAIISRYRDGAYKRIRFTMRNIPGYSRRPSSLTSQNAIRYEHTFSFDLPREYPQNIGAIRPLAETPLYHPRLSTGGKGHACYSVRGELDRILEELPFFVLLKPDRVQPPSRFNSDHGLNAAAMSWYERDIENIVSTLDRLWDERQRTLTPRRPVPSPEDAARGRVRILQPSSPSQTGRRPPKILETPSPRRFGRVQVLDEEDD